MRKLFFLVTLMFGVQAQAKDCTFVPREEVKQVLSEMPSSVIGWVNCHEEFPQLSVFVVARFARPDDVAMKAYLQEYAKLAVYSGTTSKFLKYKVTHSGMRQALLETKRINDMDPSQHYAFTTTDKDGSTLLYVHTEGAKETSGLTDTLDKLRLILTGPRFLEQLHPVKL